MQPFSALLAICAGNSPVTGEFPAQRPVTRSFAVFFDLHLNKRLSKQSWGWLFETPSRPLWRHCIAHFYYPMLSLASRSWLDNNRDRRAANPQKVFYLRSLMHPPPPTHLVCNDHLIANVLSFHMSLVVVVNCDARNALRGFETSMFYFFLKLYFTHISKDILTLRAQSAIKQCK